MGTEIFIEKEGEQRLLKEVKLLGGLCLKFTSPGNRGVPDRIILLPMGRIYFLEMKSTGKEPRELQYWWGRQLKFRGHDWDWVNSWDQLHKYINKLRNGVQTTQLPKGRI